jgi:transcriptional regulator with XRE-family HTH domain
LSDQGIAVKKSALGTRSTTFWGTRLREERELRNLTLREVSEICHLSISQLSKIESGKARMTVETALLISNALDIPVVSFFAPANKNMSGARSITRNGQAVVNANQNIKFEVLSSDLKDKKALYWRVTVNARSLAEAGWRSHFGEEFLYVLSGTLELHTSHYDPLVLNPGDSIVFDGGMDHSYVSIGTEPAMLTMSNSMP